MPHPALANFLEQHALPEAYLAEANQHFLPLLDDIRQLLEHKRPLVFVINGCQGSGKTTLAAWLQTRLSIEGLDAVSLSLDDFYLSHADRQALAVRIHPLLATRGVPGTHDIPLALQTLSALKNGQPVAIPRFDKARDDCVPRSNWQIQHQPADVVILEGWCVGARPQTDQALLEPVNLLEALEDSDGHWRSYVNRQLTGDYQTLYAMADRLAMLKAPDFNCVYHWRLEQEQKLAKKLQDEQRAKKHTPDGLMSAGDVLRFVQFFERLTRHMLNTLPEQADDCFYLNSRRQIIDEKHRHRQ